MDKYSIMGPIQIELIRVFLMIIWGQFLLIQPKKGYFMGPMTKNGLNP